MLKQLQGEINEFAESISSLSQTGDVVMVYDFSDDDVAPGYEYLTICLGTDDIYYLSFSPVESKCFEGCEDEDSCNCHSQFPNSLAFFTPQEAANFIVLNLLHKP